MTRPFPTRPNDVPEFANATLDAIVSTRGGVALMDYFTAPLAGVDPDTRSDENSTNIALAALAGLVTGWTWLDPDYVRFVTAAEPTMPPTPYVTADQVPSLAGSLWMPTPCAFTADDGTYQRVHAVTWAATGVDVADDETVKGTAAGMRICVLFGWTWPGDPDDQTNASIAERWPDAWAATSHLPLHPAASMMIPVVTDPDAATRLADRTITAGEYATTVGQSSMRHPLGRFVVATWALWNARATESTTPTHDRATRRRLERAGLPTEPVRVVSVRRPTGAGGSTSTDRRDWSHRWVVSGHWRRQWYPAAGVHRTIWIDPYVKGPDDAPLLDRPTVHRPVAP